MMDDRIEKRKKRLHFLQNLLNKIRSGEYCHFSNSEEYPFPRREYRHPSELGGYNYGYMTSGESAEMAAVNKDPKI